jgi:hypothetical protein
MNRNHVIEVIKKEREYQNTTWPRTDAEVIEMYSYAAPHLLLLKQYMNKIRAAWEVSREENPVIKQIAKLATIAVRSLQEHRLTKDQDVFKAIERRSIQLDPIAEGEAIFSAPHIICLDNLIEEAYSTWQSGYESRAMSTLPNIAAVAFRALEQIERGALNLLATGLR